MVGTFLQRTRENVTNAVSWATWGWADQVGDSALEFGSPYPFRACTPKGHLRCDLGNLGGSILRETPHTAAQGVGEVPRLPDSPSRTWPTVSRRHTLVVLAVRQGELRGGLSPAQGEVLTRGGAPPARALRPSSSSLPTSGEELVGAAQEHGGVRSSPGGMSGRGVPGTSPLPGTGAAQLRSDAVVRSAGRRAALRGGRARSARPPVCWDRAGQLSVQTGLPGRPEESPVPLKPNVVWPEGGMALL